MSQDTNYHLNEPLTSTVRPDSMAIITIRIIKSFPYRTVRNHVFKDINLLTTTVNDLLDQIKRVIGSESAFRAYRNVNLDTLKIYTKAHGSKTMNLIINFDHDDDWILSDLSRTLHSYGIENETEISAFNRADYESFKINPEEKWL